MTVIIVVVFNSALNLYSFSEISRTGLRVPVGNNIYPRMDDLARRATETQNSLGIFSILTTRELTIVIGAYNYAIKPRSLRLGYSPELPEITNYNTLRKTHLELPEYEIGFEKPLVSTIKSLGGISVLEAARDQKLAQEKAEYEQRLNREAKAEVDEMIANLKLYGIINKLNSQELKVVLDAYYAAEEESRARAGKAAILADIKSEAEQKYNSLRLAYSGIFLPGYGTSEGCLNNIINRAGKSEVLDKIKNTLITKAEQERIAFDAKRHQEFEKEKEIVREFLSGLDEAELRIIISVAHRDYSFINPGITRPLPLISAIDMLSFFNYLINGHIREEVEPELPENLLPLLEKIIAKLKNKAELVNENDIDELYNSGRYFHLVHYTRLSQHAKTIVLDRLLMYYNSNPSNEGFFELIGEILAEHILDNPDYVFSEIMAERTEERKALDAAYDLICGISKNESHPLHKKVEELKAKINMMHFYNTVIKTARSMNIILDIPEIKGTFYLSLVGQGMKIISEIPPGLIWKSMYPIQVSFEYSDSASGETIVSDPRGRVILKGKLTEKYDNIPEMRGLIMHEIIGHRVSTATTSEGKECLSLEDCKDIAKRNGFIGYLDENLEFQPIDSLQSMSQLRSISYHRFIFEQNGKRYNYIDTDLYPSMIELLKLEGKYNIEITFYNTFICAIKGKYDFYQHHIRASLGELISEAVSHSQEEFEAKYQGFNYPFIFEILQRNLFRSEYPVAIGEDGRPIYEFYSFSQKGGWKIERKILPSQLDMIVSETCRSI